jgi:Nif-specific regulatory protein
MGQYPMFPPGLSAAPAIDANDITLGGIYEISKLLASNDRLEIILSAMLALMSSHLDMRGGLFSLLDETGAPNVAIGSGWSENNVKLHPARIPLPAIQQIIATKTPLVVENAHASPLFKDSVSSAWRARDDRPFSLIGVPIKHGDDVVGTLTAERPFKNAATIRFDRDIRFLTMVAHLVSQTLRLQKRTVRERGTSVRANARLRGSERPRSSKPKDRALKGIVGDSPAMRAVVTKLQIVAKSRATVLLRGETGTGKELFAAAIHSLSTRHAKPFIKLNCAALPEATLESELFGHERGAFTGAMATRKGRFELADGGTLFLDEIGDISMAFQARLVSVLEVGEIIRIGGTRHIKVDVRFVCATNRNLEDLVKRGLFRPDLYYRINVVQILAPSLRERKGDLMRLANEFLRRFNAEQKSNMTIAPTAIPVLKRCRFPGNIRELQNCIFRAATMAQGDQIDACDFACQNDGCLSAMLWKKGAHPVTGWRRRAAPVRVAS